MKGDSEQEQSWRARDCARIDRPAVIIILVALILFGCGRHASSPHEQVSGASLPQSEAVIDLTPDQLHVVKIEPVDTYRFSVKEEAVGSVSFEEDPATVQAEAALIGDAATFVLTEKELKRAESLYGTKGVSQRELEQAASDEQSAQSAYKAARDAVRALGVTDADIDRLVAADNIESGTRAHSRRKWVAANVTESDSPRVRVGQSVAVSVIALPGRVFEGRVSKVYAAVDPNVHRVLVRCDVADPNDELRVGMLSDVVIQVQQPIESIALPENGVVREGDGTMTVWITTDRHRFVQRIIQTGMRADGQVQILRGLRRGELVVTNGAIFLDNMLQAPPSD